jgi:hypothetical protein
LLVPGVVIIHHGNILIANEEFFAVHEFIRKVRLVRLGASRQSNGPSHTKKTAHPRLGLGRYTPTPLPPQERITQFHKRYCFIHLAS